MSSRSGVFILTLYSSKVALTNKKPSWQKIGLSIHINPASRVALNPPKLYTGAFVAIKDNVT